MNFTKNMKSVDKNTKGAQPMSLGIFHLSSYFCKNLGEDNESRLKELEAVIKGGYINTLLISPKESDFEAVID